MKKLGRPPSGRTARVREIMALTGCSYRTAYERWKKEQEYEGLRPKAGSAQGISEIMDYYHAVGITEEEARVIYYGKLLFRQYEQLLEQRNSEAQGSAPDSADPLSAVKQAKRALRAARMSGDRAVIDEAAKIYRDAREAAGLPALAAAAR
jgi:hypothetical protein